MRGFSVTDGNGCHFRGLQCCLEVLIRSWSCIWKVGGSPKEVAVIERRCQERDRRCSCGSDKWRKLYQGEDLASVTIRADSPSVIEPMSSNDHPMSSHTSYHWPSMSSVWTNNRSSVVLQCIGRIILPPGRTTSLIVMDDGLSQNQISVRMSLNVQNIFVCKCIGINDWLSMPIVSRWS